MPLESGQTFAGYKVIRQLGSGGMGEVYLAQHPRLPRQDALKILREDVSRDASFRERFIREADLAAGLRHPNIVGVHDRGEYEGQLWIAMDYVDGTDAAHLLEQRHSAGLPIDLALPIITAVARALDYAHKKGVLHRDVKPANIMLTHLDDEDEQQILLTDFGIARNVDEISGITATNMTVGTVAYCAPEQLLGDDVDGRADQYALAASAYHLLTGSQLFPHSNPAVVISRHLNIQPPALAETRPELAGLDPVLAVALAKLPADRFRRCSDFARALADESTDARTAGGSSAAPTRPAPVPRPTPPSVADGNGRKRNSPSTDWKVSGVVAAVLLVVAGLASIWRPWTSSDPSSSTQASPSSRMPDGEARMTSTPQPTARTTPPREPAVSGTSTALASTTTVPRATLGSSCADHHKIVYDPASGQELACSEQFVPSYGWLWEAAPSTDGVHKQGTSCEGQRPWSASRTADDYVIICEPADITSSSPTAGPGSTWKPPSNI
ncbi:serine/threonine protein kinase [Mycobacterium paragordonae]|uniref:serine/threonine-protein kinase n=1 Tax=Mycobacterium paragordonae TaxID=1389713 RepID=UPI00105D7071|nr:serine/threonine-protein kinase [Mycobacterium paragordonae]TDK96495.1 serine/threonine protein kinase [Mycobacterium paragordonae]